MNLHEIIETISNSKPHEWNTMDHPNAGRAFCRVEEEENFLSHREHSHVSAYIPNPQISIAWGAEHMRDFEEPWAKDFPDTSAHSAYVEVSYCGALVFRDIYVSVDGWRAQLPLPHIHTMLVPKPKARFFRLLDKLEGYISAYDEYFRRARLVAVDEPWPVFSGEKDRFGRGPAQKMGLEPLFKV
ncbi:MAG: hypothetical protein SFV51_07165 [Bryobacteraceae bacterium]|nr:hypothetical protein [Bryobacteraceae bacterium]